MAKAIQNCLSNKTMILVDRICDFLSSFNFLFSQVSNALQRADDWTCYVVTVDSRSGKDKRKGFFVICKGCLP